MWKWKKSSLPWLVWLAGVPGLAGAELLLDYQVQNFNIVDYGLRASVGSVGVQQLQVSKSMPSIVFTPTALPLQGYAVYGMQNGYVTNGPYRLSLPPGAQIRNNNDTTLQNTRNIQRARAYRLDYFKK